MRYGSVPLMPVFLRQLKDIGFSGVQNFPTVGLFEARPQNLEETGMSFGLEVEMIALAHDLGLLTVPYVFTADDARHMPRPARMRSCRIWGSRRRARSARIPQLQSTMRCAGCRNCATPRKSVNPDFTCFVNGGPIAGRPTPTMYCAIRLVWLASSAPQA